jgi:nucleoside-diphosphate kinase
MEFCGPRDSVVAKQIRPKLLRGLFGTDVVHNAVHCTDLDKDAALETEYFFALLES